LRRKLNITWQLPSGTRSEAIDYEVAMFMFRSGCRNLAYAPETGSDRIRKIVKKRVKLDAMLESIDASLRAGLSLSCFFVIGFPDDTDETLAETLELVKELTGRGLHDIGVAKFVPYPGSELFERFLNEGRIRLDDEYFLSLDAYAEGKHTASFCDALTSAQLHRWQLRLLSNFYARSIVRYPRRAVSNAWAVLSTGHEETRYAKMIRDVFKTRARWKRLLASSE
jgi:anaerobic magnesium-protoporphyrin IX monomethyl ester cyclase